MSDTAFAVFTLIAQAQPKAKNKLSGSSAMLTTNSTQALDQLINLALPRLENLWQRANTVPGEEKALMWESLEQITNAFEEIYAAMEDLCLHTEELEAANEALAKESRRYQELFEFAPCGYLVTDVSGVIQEANQAVAKLLKITQPLLLTNKPLCVFIAQEAQRDFFKQINQLQTGKELRGWQVRLQPHQGIPFPVSCTISPVQNSYSEVNEFRWLLQEV